MTFIPPRIPNTGADAVIAAESKLASPAGSSLRGPSPIEPVRLAPGQLRMFDDPDRSPASREFFATVAAGQALMETAARQAEHQVVTGRRDLSRLSPSALAEVASTALAGKSLLQRAEAQAGGWDHANLYVSQAVQNIDAGMGELAAARAELTRSRPTTLPERNMLLGRIGIAASQFEGARWLTQAAPLTNDDWVGDQHTIPIRMPAKVTLPPA